MDGLRSDGLAAHNSFELGMCRLLSPFSLEASSPSTDAAERLSRGRRQSLSPT